MTKFLALLSLFLFLPSRKILKCPVRTSSTNLRLQHIILQLKNIRINPPLESVLSLTTFIQNAAICSSILTTLLFSFFKPVLRPTVRIMQQSSEEGESNPIAHRHPLRSLRMLVLMRAMLSRLSCDARFPNEATKLRPTNNGVLPAIGAMEGKDSLKLNRKS